MKAYKPFSETSLPLLESLFSGVLLLSGVITLLSFFVFALYVAPDIEQAHSSVVYAQAFNPGLADLYRTGIYAEQLLLVSIFALLSLLFLRRGYRERGCVTSRWYLLVFLFLSLSLWSFFKGILVMDQEAWHTSLVRIQLFQELFHVSDSFSQRVFGSRTLDALSFYRFSFYALGFFPWIMLGLLWCFWKQRGKLQSYAFVYGVFFAAFILFVVTAWAGHSTDLIGTSAQRSEAYQHARPEWYFLPFSLVLGELGNEVGRLCLILLTFGLIGLPWLSHLYSPRFDKPLYACLLLAFFGLLFWGYYEDYQAESGYFHSPDVEEVMTKFGKLNRQLGYKGEEVDSAQAYASVADLLVLARQTENLLYTPKKNKVLMSSKDWKKWSQETYERTLALWTTPPAQLAQARDELRQACLSCHDAYQIDAELYDQPLSLGDLDKVTTSEAKAFWRFSKQALNQAQAKNKELKTSQGLKAVMKGTGRAYDVLNKGASNLSAEALVQLEAYTEASFKLYDDEDAGLNELASRFEWEEPLKLLQKELGFMAQSQEESAFRKSLSRVRSYCLSCHASFYVEDVELDEVLGLQD